MEVENVGSLFVVENHLVFQGAILPCELQGVYVFLFVSYQEV